MSENKLIRIGTRGSDLALWQANHVKSQLEQLGCAVEITIIQTQGDRIQDLSFDKLEGKGFFTKEIEAALLNESVDLAVHSHKDLETNQPEGLKIIAVSDREDPSELLLIHPHAFVANQKWGLRENAVIGTSSARRKSQILALRPDLEIKDLRGNVPTRIQKLRDGNYDAILLAKAGVNRLNLDLSDLSVLALNPLEFVPAPAQGVLGLQIRANDARTAQFVERLNHAETAVKIGLERAVLQKMEGGCQLPLGVYNDGENVHISFAKNASEASQYFHLHFSEEENLADQIVAQLKSL